MTALRPRRLVHRGRVEAAGLLFDEALLGPEEVQRRVLALWQPGAEVFRPGDRLLLLRLARTIWVDAALAPGSPLVGIGTRSPAEGTVETLSAAPLDDDEASALVHSGETAVLIRAGVARAVPLGSIRSEDPAEWIDLNGWRIEPMRSLGRQPPAPPLTAPSPPPSARNALGGRVPSADPERAGVLEALSAGTGRGAPDPASAGAPRDSWRLRLASWLAGGPTATASSSTSPRSPPSRLFARLRARLSHLLMGSSLGQLIGRSQGRYLGRMMELFESGAFEEALRRAIPIGGDIDPTVAAALGTPSPRSDLEIRPHRSPAGSAYLLPHDVTAELIRLYRRSVEILEARGNLEQAAFVLAELLNADAEAVAFLERHGRLRQAAELAEARGLPPGLVVRQWFVAGDIERAILVARRTGAFADALLRLERQGHPQAPCLRLLWAESLAAAGDYLPAVKAAWPIAEARRLVGRWIELGLAAAGPAAPALLAHRVAIGPPDRTAEATREVRELLARDDAAAATDKVAFVTALAGLETTSQVRTLARLATRAGLPIMLSGELPVGVYRSLIQLAGDGPLRADLRGLPSSPSRRPGTAVAALRPWRLEAGDHGAREIYDAARLPSGRFLVALGEAGVELLTRDGRKVAVFDQPAHRLVVADHGTRALALARRGESWKLARLDLATLRSAAWCDLSLDAFTDSYDGGLWFAATDGSVLAIDCRADGPAQSLWRIPEVPGRVLAMAWSPSFCHFLVHGELMQCWRLALPALTLRARDDLPYVEIPLVAAVSTAGQVAVAQWAEPAEESDAFARVLVFRDGQLLTTHTLPAAPGGPVHLTVLAEGSLLVAQAAPDGLHLSRWAAPRNCEDWGFLGGATRGSIRSSGDFITLADDRGRLLVYDLRTEQAAANLRL